jgi:predicted CXXCH cytochrome family protein
MPTPNGVAACTSCHSDQAELQKTKAHQHQPAFEQGCATCHEPHGGDNAHLLRSSSTNKLCLECHAPDVQPKKLEADHLVAIFNGAVKLPENYFLKVPTLPIKYGRGHPVEGHPVSDIMDPTDPGKVAKPLNCLSCHQPHASAKENLLVKDQEVNGEFCDSCHKGTAK